MRDPGRRRRPPAPPLNLAEAADPDRARAALGRELGLGRARWLLAGLAGLGGLLLMRSC